MYAKLINLQKIPEILPPGSTAPISPAQVPGGVPQAARSGPLPGEGGEGAVEHARQASEDSCAFDRVGREVPGQGGRTNFGGFVLSCIDAEFCKLKPRLKDLAKIFTIHTFLQISDLICQLYECQIVAKRFEIFWLENEF